MASSEKLEAEVKHIVSDIGEMKTDMRKLRERTDAIHDTLLQKIDTSHSAVLTKIDANQVAANTEFSKVGEKLDGLRDRLDAALAASDAKIDDLRKAVDGKSDALQKWAEGKFDAAQKATDGKFDSLQKWAEGKFDAARKSTDGKFDSLRDKLDQTNKELGDVRTDLEKLMRRMSIALFGMAATILSVVARALHWI